MNLLDRAARFIDDVILLPEDLRRALEDGEDALRNERFERAETFFRRVLNERPSLLRARQGLALVYEARGELALARDVVDGSRELDPDDPEVLLLSARLSLAQKEWARTIDDARDAARRANKEGGVMFAEACALRARAEWALGRPDRAVRELRKALAVMPDWTEARIELVDALIAARRAPQAVQVLKHLETASLSGETALRLGLALVRAGQSARAKPLLEGPAAAGEAKASQALAQIALREGDAETAELRARQAIAQHGGQEAMMVLAAVLESQDKMAEASEIVWMMVGQPPEPDLLRRAARMTPLEDVAALARAAKRCVDGEEEVLAAALRAHAALARDAVEEAAEVLGEAASEPRWILAAAAVALASGRAQEALDVLAQDGRFAKCDQAAVRDLRHRALRALWRVEGGEIDLASAIDRVAAFAKDRALDDLSRRTLALRDELDRPLLLAILGEFNAGKSTLVNAFVGADVAPTGILPTTATLNVLRGGAERLVRVVRDDGTTREGDYTQLKPLLRSVEESEGQRVDRVEIVLPSEVLERVWILDTPGSNAPVAEHEALAREAMRRADAALWIFDAGQAGKATEGRVLEAVRASKRHVVAAINKVDRLREGQLAQVRESLARELPGVGGEVVALSAKKALKARMAEDEEALVQSGFPELMRRLEQDVFARARPLKRRACGGRLLSMLNEALNAEHETTVQFQARIEAAEEVVRGLPALEGQLERAATEALKAFEEAQEAAFEGAAKEVLAFVRPRGHRFARHGADLEDRQFLAELIESQVEGAQAAFTRRLSETWRVMLQEVATALAWSSARLDDQIQICLQLPMSRFAGYQQGLLQGGALHRFFEEGLPNAELALAPIMQMLLPVRAHPRARLRPALEEAAGAMVAQMAQSAEGRVQESRDAIERWNAETFEPLRALRDVLEELVD